MSQKNNDAALEEKKSAAEGRSPAAQESHKEVTNPEDNDQWKG